jgi:hypothetical protein
MAGSELISAQKAVDITFSISWHKTVQKVGEICNISGVYLISFLVLVLIECKIGIHSIHALVGKMGGKHC